MTPSPPKPVLLVCLSMVLSAGCMGLPGDTDTSTPVEFTTERSSKLVVTNELNQSISINVAPKNSTDSETLSKQYPGDQERIELTGLFDDGGTYDIEIESGDSVLWSGTKRPNEVFTVNIDSDGGVRQQAYSKRPDDVHPTAASANRLTINSALPDNISVTLLLRDDSESAVFSKTYDSPEGNLYVGDAMVSGVSYKVILHSDGTILWQDTISASEGYVLNVNHHGNVTVSAHAEY